MTCPHCGGWRAIVTETRLVNGAIFRRRKCLAEACRRSYVTQEITSAEMKMPPEVERARPRRQPPKPKAAKPPKPPKMTMRERLAANAAKLPPKPAPEPLGPAHLPGAPVITAQTKITVYAPPPGSLHR